MLQIAAAAIAAASKLLQLMMLCSLLVRSGAADRSSRSNTSGSKAVAAGVCPAWPDAGDACAGMLGCIA